MQRRLERARDTFAPLKSKEIPSVFRNRPASGPRD